MIHHRCRFPAADGRVTVYACDECRWVWRLNPLVLRWFRELPDVPP